MCSHGIVLGVPAIELLRAHEAHHVVLVLGAVVEEAGRRKLPSDTQTRQLPDSKEISPKRRTFFALHLERAEKGQLLKEARRFSSRYISSGAAVAIAVEVNLKFGLKTLSFA